MYKLDYASPIGVIEISGTEHFIASVLFAEREEIVNFPANDTPQLLLDCSTELDEYFKGRRKDFSVLYKLQGTMFQTTVWQALTTVPYGKTASYKEIAQQIENEKAVRAVGMTNSKNVISIIVPCHRIIGKNGKLTGYAGGLWRKQWLLEHELKYSFNLD
ncbi:methylated-DNA-[protein]-cysteine S-methyltransferase [Solibacillus kalamii]|uniref:Methylated-DNA--protein-cysteine methyltransferase n=1 Tax=Solibacillus kalamii TaxID=1748298 RepID=A0ABX3ZFD5_9BACL|nr:methylated-DNA--[protein]-cysteine S-methyltransferase [Solibacillus kalamii]MBM7666218.1 methylated-DNA-[protein]-cysteine S-methyltransferase [Solibacillus kalamii]OUZ38371.1 cysteine methyltransferase [Solibacillus kalamii]